MPGPPSTVTKAIRTHLRLHEGHSASLFTNDKLDWIATHVRRVFEFGDPEKEPVRYLKTGRLDYTRRSVINKKTKSIKTICANNPALLLAFCLEVDPYSESSLPKDETFRADSPAICEAAQETQDRRLCKSPTPGWGISMLNQFPCIDTASTTKIYDAVTAAVGGDRTKLPDQFREWISQHDLLNPAHDTEDLIQGMREAGTTSCDQGVLPVKRARTAGRPLGPAMCDILERLGVDDPHSTLLPTDFNNWLSDMIRVQGIADIDSEVGQERIKEWKATSGTLPPQVFRMAPSTWNSHQTGGRADKPSMDELLGLLAAGRKVGTIRGAPDDTSGRLQVMKDVLVPNPFNPASVHSIYDRQGRWTVGNQQIDQLVERSYSRLFKDENDKNDPEVSINFGAAYAMVNPHIDSGVRVLAISACGGVKLWAFWPPTPDNLDIFRQSQDDNESQGAGFRDLAPRLTGGIWVVTRDEDDQHMNGRGQNGGNVVLMDRLVIHATYTLKAGAITGFIFSDASCLPTAELMWEVDSKTGKVARESWFYLLEAIACARLDPCAEDEAGATLCRHYASISAAITREEGNQRSLSTKKVVRDAMGWKTRTVPGKTGTRTREAPTEKLLRENCSSCGLGWNVHRAS